MTNEDTQPHRPVMRRATEAGCAGWAPITRPPAEPAPAISAAELAAPDSVDDGSSSPVSKPLPGA